MAKTTANKKVPTRQVCTHHMKPVADGGLGKSQQASTFPLERFSLLKSGKRRKICKPCQTLLSLDWTRKRADYRKVYQLSRALRAEGIAVRAVNAKDFKTGDVVRYETTGKPYNPNAKTQPQLKAETASA